MLWQWIAQGYPYVTEIATMRDIEYIDLPLAVSAVHPSQCG
jgi:hypothetical protein